MLPRTPLDVVKLKAMNVDVTYSAADIRHVKELPLDFDLTGRGNSVAQMLGSASGDVAVLMGNPVQATAQGHEYFESQVAAAN